jgi:uncharacterized protein GlcG (DUF336 family)
VLRCIYCATFDDRFTLLVLRVLSTLKHYLTRSPCAYATAATAATAEMLEKVVSESLVDLGGQRRFTRVSGARVYSTNTRTLAAVGAAELQEALQAEVAQATSAAQAAAAS